MNKIADLLAEHAVQAMVAANKIEERKLQMQDLQAVVYERSKNKLNRKTNADKDADNTPAPIQPARGVKKSRRM